MKLYTLLALSVGARNRVLHKGDNKEYPESYWPEGVADKLVEQGFLKLVSGKDTVKASKDEEQDVKKAEKAAKKAEEKAAKAAAAAEAAAAPADEAAAE